MANLLRLPRQGPLSSSPPTFPPWAPEALPDIECKLASLMCIQPGGCCPMCRLASRTSSPTTSSTRLSRWCAAWRPTASARAPASTTCATRHTPCTAPRSRCGALPPRFGVSVFDGLQFLATAVVSAPQIMVKSVGNVLDGFRDLPTKDREILFEMFRWCPAGQRLLRVRHRVGTHCSSQHRARTHGDRPNP